MGSIGAAVQQMAAQDGFFQLNPTGTGTTDSRRDAMDQSLGLH
jgi:hypothetical protein